ncbi:hypothetical protein PPIS_a2686 [Pseudoalteromonas piscicida]|uniref:Uncharacterized protein n=1 Tax=Pseudoalteromonas piscicida TaxID=43662 RepID=A0ABN5CFJ6_PSEO7|nr:hypothetical protein PPIS_a2686 [Pseudoalteromonas piscicida]
MTSLFNLRYKRAVIALFQDKSIPASISLIPKQTLFLIKLQKSPSNVD